VFKKELCNGIPILGRLYSMQVGFSYNMSPSSSDNRLDFVGRHGEIFSMHKEI
jgi:hypothetical protein